MGGNKESQQKGGERRRKFKREPEGQGQRQEAKQAARAPAPHGQTHTSHSLPNLLDACWNFLLQQPAKQVNTRRAVYPHSCCTLSFRKEKANPLPSRGCALFVLDFHYLELEGAESTSDGQEAGRVDRCCLRFPTLPHLCQLKGQSHLGSWGIGVGTSQPHSTTTLTAQMVGGRGTDSSHSGSKWPLNLTSTSRKPPESKQPPAGAVAAMMDNTDRL